jgi:hypothetical protein
MNEMLSFVLSSMLSSILSYTTRPLLSPACGLRGDHLNPAQGNHLKIYCTRVLMNRRGIFVAKV